MRMLLDILVSFGSVILIYKHFLNSLVQTEFCSPHCHPPLGKVFRIVITQRKHSS